MHRYFWWGNIKEINLFEDKGTDNRVILKRI
jgi:hypothetical protein